MGGYFKGDTLNNEIEAILKTPSFLLYFSGLQIQYVLKKPSGIRVGDIKVRCAACQVPVYERLDESAVYKVLLTSYLANGGRGLGIEKMRLSHHVGNLTYDVATMNYFRAKSPITTGVENRITFVYEEDKKPVICGAAGNIQALNMLLTLAVMAYSAIRHVA